MIEKIYKELAILLIIFIGIWVVFIYVPIMPEAPENALSIENEQQIGDLLIETYLEQADLLNDSLINSVVDKIHKRLISGLDSTDYDYRIYVVKDEDINAFASLGGNVVIFSGLLKYADSPEEVAAVLAHEIGHVEERHVVNKVVKELGITLLLSVLSGGDPGFTYEIIQQSISSVFDRKQESSADDYGLKLLENSQIHPNAMAAIFRKIRDKYSSSTYETLELLSTHPNTNKRIKKSLEYKTDEKFEPKPFIDIDWDKVKESI